jgi:hypothetical protein
MACHLWKQATENAFTIKLSTILILFLHINYPAAIKVLVHTEYNPRTTTELAPLYGVIITGSTLKFLVEGGYPK